MNDVLCYDGDGQMVLVMMSSKRLLCLRHTPIAAGAAVPRCFLTEEAPLAALACSPLRNVLGSRASSVC
jgi:hypothetical protein